MIRWYYDLLYGSTPAEFESDYQLEESVERLAAVVQPRTWFGPAMEAVVGQLRTDDVSLARVIPSIRNSFKPFFIGRFREVEGSVVLRGHFTLHVAVKLLLTYMLLLCFFMMTVSMFLDSAGWLLRLTMFITPLPGLTAFVGFCKWLARSDTQWISQVIRFALTAKPPHSDLPK